MSQAEFSTINKVMRSKDKAILSQFQGISPQTTSTVYLNAVLDSIQDGTYQSDIATLRNASLTKQSELKLSLPSVSFAAYFPKYRSTKVSDNCKTVEWTSTGFAMMDIDKLMNYAEAQSVRDELFEKHKYIMAAFVSPRGEGVKLLCRIPKVDTLEQYDAYFDAIATKNFHPKIDTANGGIGRCTFLSWDSYMRFRPEEETEVFTLETVEKNIHQAHDEPSKSEPIPKVMNRPKKEGRFTKDETKVRMQIYRALDNVNPDNRHGEIMKAMTLVGGYVPRYCSKEFVLEHAYAIIDLDAKYNQKEKRKKNIRKAVEHGMESPIELRDGKLERMADYIETLYPRGDIVCNELKNNELVFKDGGNVTRLYVNLKFERLAPTKPDLVDYLTEIFAIKYHPVKQYFATILNTYTYEAVAGSIERLSMYVYAKNQKLFNSMFRKHLIRSVAQGVTDRINRYVFVLRSEQRTGKSSFIRYLVPPELESMYGTTLDSRSPTYTLAQNFIINLEELEQFTKKDLNFYKAIISSGGDNLRKLYHETMQQWKRIATFWGSTNKDGFLSDTENTRWLPFEIESIDFNYNNHHTEQKIEIDKVWCEAAYLLQMPETNMEPTEEEWIEIKELHKEHEYLNAYDHYCREYVEVGTTFRTATEIADFINREIKPTIFPNHIGTALNKMGIDSIKKDRKRGYMVDFILPENSFPI